MSATNGSEKRDRQSGMPMFVAASLEEVRAQLDNVRTCLWEGQHEEAQLKLESLAGAVANLRSDLEAAMQKDQSQRN